MQIVNDSQFQGLIDKLIDQGWTVEKTKKSHWKAIPPDPTKKIVIISGSPRSRSLSMVKGDLRRSGAVI